MGLFLSLGLGNPGVISGGEQDMGAGLTLLHIIVLAMVQGITEFLPISSSAHLILVPIVTDWPDQGLMIDVAVHVGTLAAVMVYFWRECWSMVHGMFNLMLLRGTREARLVLYVVIATLPIIPVAWLLKDFVANDLRQGIQVIAWATRGFGVLLYIADRGGMRIRRIEHMTALSALAIGLAQLLALIPGTSRSGITMTAARFLGFERTEAARFSRLISMPVILGIGIIAALDLYAAKNLAIGVDALLAAGFAFICALITIALMLRWLERASFTPFVAYRVVLGIGLLVWIYL